ncbi:MAG TPA: hypothetical protein VLE53_06410 [Gemmatimonadaceae bacterium]|nr:hypothetical protein [Gemmatimonadaceae bacterium]
MWHRLSHLVVMATLVACGGGESESADSADSATTAAAAAPNVVTFTASDFAFDAPDTIPAGLTTIRLVNRGPELHHAQLVRFNEGKTLADFMQALQAGGPPPAWAEEMGGPNPPAPGEESNATQNLEPGNYAVVCFVDTPDKVPHVAKGMMKAFTVVPSTSTAGEPAADVTMRLADYTFTLSDSLEAGMQTIRVENAAQQPHEVFLVQFAPGKSMPDLLKWAETYQGPPPGKPMGGIAAIGSGQHAFFTVTLTPGEYGLLCFVPDAKDGKPHIAHGMMQTLKVPG